MIENEDEKGIENNQAESGSQEKPEEEDVKPKRRGLSSRGKKILVVVVIIVIALTVTLWGAAPGDYMSVGDVVKNSDRYIGKEIEVKGKVGNWSGGNNFTLVDEHNVSLAIHVVHNGGMPEGFTTGKFVVVKGRLSETENGLNIRSSKIQVGCPSKY